ncbi:hypothetical protein I0P70_13450 [Pontibacter sp. FD36]|uniref:DUF3592 domain-containing protein n=1 Tax=Pontibacter sp. FD36 TaxID=2789860 RepID=UPI0018A96CDA|nr:DUF3592 domain-containing protein [Pontibacter sp. FD36]MBF8964255.1 hypothetical protein [Pontibacter sp. FD36]
MNLHISKAKFLTVLVLILLLPLLSKSRLLLFGLITEGEVIGYEEAYTRSLRFSGKTTYSIVEFKTAKDVITMLGPPNSSYEFGEKVNVIYLQNDPDDCAIMSFSDIYLGLNAVLPAMLLLLWVCLYVSLKEYAAQHAKSKRSMPL